MTAIMAEPQARPTAEAKRALFETLAARFGDRFSLSQALREQHANTLTWLKCQPPEAVLFAKTQEEISEIVRLCAKARMPVIRPRSSNVITSIGSITYVRAPAFVVTRKWNAAFGPLIRRVSSSVVFSVLSMPL